VHKLLVGREPIDGEDLASQPTLSRFENAPDRKELFRLGEALADCVIERHRKRLHGRARRITIDLDPTDDRHTASSSSPFSIATTIATVICRWSVSSAWSSRPCVPLGGCRRKVERPNTSMGSSATRPRRLGSTNGASSIRRSHSPSEPRSER